MHQPHKPHVNADEAAETDGPTAERRRTAVQRAEQEMTDGADAEVIVREKMTQLSVNVRQAARTESDIFLL